MHVFLPWANSDEKISIDTAIDKTLKKYDIPKFSGSTKAPAWSYLSSIQKCPRFFYNRYVERGEYERSFYLEVGICVHFFIAMHYARRLRNGFLGHHLVEDGSSFPLVDTLKSDLLVQGGDVEVIHDSWRIFEGYRDHYFQDYVKPLAIEYKQVIDDPHYSCRFDLIAEVQEGNNLHVSPGTYNIDAKTASRFDQVTLEGWSHDGELHGQMLIYQKANLQEKFGELKGTIVDLIGKQKQQKFQRIIVPLQKSILDEFEREIVYWKSEVDRHKKRGWFPKAEANCISRYGLCDYYYRCW